jgi:hypothetical protein
VVSTQSTTRYKGILFFFFFFFSSGPLHNISVCECFFVQVVQSSLYDDNRELKTNLLSVDGVLFGDSKWRFGEHEVQWTSSGKKQPPTGGALHSSSV